MILCHGFHDSVFIMSTHPNPMAFFSPSPASYANCSSSGVDCMWGVRSVHRR